MKLRCPRDALLSENRGEGWVPFNNHNLCIGDIFPQEAREEQIIHINEKHSMLADETSRTRFKTRFQVSGNERCNIQPSAVFFLSPSSFCFRALQSDHLWTTTNQAFSLFLSLRRCIEEACYSHIIMQFTANRDEFRHSCSRDLNFSPKRRNENF